MTVRIETERLILRPFTRADIDPSYEMNIDPRITKYTGDGGVVSRAEMEKRITENVMGDYVKHGFGRFAVELKSTGEFIGFSGLKYLPEYDAVDLGYRFLVEHWGKGLATESGKASLDFGFETLGLKKIIAFAMPPNQGSIRVLEKLGFQFECEMMDEDNLVKKYVIQKP